MKCLTLTLLAAAAAFSLPAAASVIDVTYTGTVSVASGTTANSGYADGASITGQFFIDSETDIVSGSTLGVFSAPAVPGSASLSSTDAIYTQAEYASAQAPLNQSISVDLSASNGFSGSDPAAFLLQSPATLAQLIDFTGAASSFPSNVIYYSADGAVTM